MTAISTNVCFDLLDDFVNKYNNRVHRIIKMNVFAKGYTQNWFEEVFGISKINNTVSWT